MMRMLAWWGTNRAMSPMSTLARSRDGVGRLDRGPHGPAEHFLPRITIPDPSGRRTEGRTRVPSTPRSQPSSEPSPGTASTTTAPAPSPNRKAFVRSAQLVARVRVSAPIEQDPLDAGGDQAGGGDQAVGEAGAGGVEVHGAAGDARARPTRPPRWPGWSGPGWWCTGSASRCRPRVTPARSRASRPASMARAAVVPMPSSRVGGGGRSATNGPPAARRVRMPLRSTIHSSLVSNRVAMSSLVTSAPAGLCPNR